MSKNMYEIMDDTTKPELTLDRDYWRALARKRGDEIEELEQKLGGLEIRLDDERDVGFIKTQRIVKLKRRIKELEQKVAELEDWKNIVIEYFKDTQKFNVDTNIVDTIRRNR